MGTMKSRYILLHRDMVNTAVESKRGARHPVTLPVVKIDRSCSGVEDNGAYSLVTSPLLE